MADLAAIALRELTRRRAAASATVRAGSKPRAEAEQHIRHWCGIAAWFGAVLPEELRPWPGLQSWIDHQGEGQTIEAWLREIAHELRRAALHAQAAADAKPDDKDLADRAAGLIALDIELTPRAGLPIFALAPARKEAA